MCPAAEVARTLFPLEEALGQAIYIEQDVYEVVGVLAPRNGDCRYRGSFAAQDYAKVFISIWIPFKIESGDLITTRTGSSRETEYLELSQITLQLNSKEQVKIPRSPSIACSKKSIPALSIYTTTIPLELLRQAENNPADVHGFIGIHRGDFASRRWDWDYEHHVGYGDGALPARSAFVRALGANAKEHHSAVFDRDHTVVSDWWFNWHSGRFKPVRCYSLSSLGLK